MKDEKSSLDRFVEVISTTADDRYKKWSKADKIGYWIVIVCVFSLIAYGWIFKSGLF